MTLLDFIKFLVSIGLSPVEIGTIIVAGLLYRKTEQLDAALHKCLESTVDPKELSKSMEKRLEFVDRYGDDKDRDNTLK